MNGTYVINGNVTRKLLPHTPAIIAEAEGVLFGANAATEGAEVFHVVRARADNIVNNKKRLLTDGASASPCSNDDSARQAARMADTGSPGTSTAAAAAAAEAAPSSSPAKSRKGCTSPAGAAKSSGMRPAMRRKIASPRQRQVAKPSGAGAGSNVGGSGDGNGGDSDDSNGNNSGGGGSNVNGDGSTNPSGSSSPGERSSQNVSTSIRETMRGAGKGLFAAAAVLMCATLLLFAKNEINSMMAAESNASTTRLTRSAKKAAGEAPGHRRKNSGVDESPVSIFSLSEEEPPQAQLPKALRR